MAKVVNRASDIIQLKDLKDGEFAEVIEWFEDGTVSNGDIIQRCGLALFILGSCSYYPEIFSKGARNYTNTKLRTLPDIISFSSFLIKDKLGMGLLGFDRRLRIIRTCRAQSL